MKQHIHAILASGLSITGTTLGQLDPGTIASLVSSLLSIIYWVRIWWKKPQTPPPSLPDIPKSRTDWKP
jgi:hypothetical protein